MRLAWLFLVTGCDQVFGLSQVLPTPDAPPDAPPPLLVQENTNFNQAATTLSVALKMLPTSQHVLVMVGGGVNGLQSVTGGGATWQRAAYSGVSATAQIWYGTTDGTNATVTLTGNGTTQMWADLTEWSALDTTATFDAGAAAGMNGGGGRTLQVMTQSAPDLLVFAVTSYGGITGPTGSWTQLVNVGAGSVSQNAWYQIVDVAGPHTASMSATGDWDAALAAFRTVQ